MPDQNTVPEKESLISAPIIPSFHEVLAKDDALALLHEPLSVSTITPVVPPIPQGAPVGMNANEQLQGTYTTGPNPGAHPANLQKKGGTEDYIKAIAEEMKNPDTVRDRFKYGRTYSYGAGYKNMNFDRYYTHSKFKDLGFSPYRDNDAHYNERSSWWDDFGRMSGQWGGLVWGGFKSIWGDEEIANENMEKRMAIGSSTRGGAGGWITNFAMNTGYTVGIMGEIILEDLALAAVEVGSFGTASAGVGYLAATRNAMAFGKLAKAWGGTYKFLKSLKSVEKSKEFWNLAKAGKTAAEVGKWLNPLEHTAQWSKSAINNINGFDKLSPLTKTVTGFGAFYRDARGINLALSEGNLEGQGGMVKHQEKLLDEFYTEHGRMPEGEEAQKIFKDAQSLKSSISLINLPTIFYTNKLVFENLFSGFKPGLKMAEGFLKGTGRFIEKTEAKAYKVGDLAVKAGEKTGWKKTADFLTKSAYLPWSKKYMVGNIAEGLQESSQDVIQNAVSNYYDKIRKDPSQVGFYSAMGSLGKGLGSTFTAQGLDTFLQGYLMGSIIQGPTGALKSGWNKVTGKSKTMEMQQEENDNATLDAANHIAKNALVFGDQNVDILSSVKLANEQKKKAVEEGDEKTAKDMDAEVEIPYFHNLAKTGNMALVTEHVDDMLTLEDADLANAYNVSVDKASDVRIKLQTLKSRAEGYQRKYELATAERPNPANPAMFSARKKDGTLKYPEQYQEEMDKYNAHENTIAALLFATEDHLRIAERMTSIGNNLAGRTNLFDRLIRVFSGGTPVANAAAQDVGQLIDMTQMSLNMASLEQQIKVLQEGDASQKKEAAQLTEKLGYMKEWTRMVDNYQKEMASESKAQISPEERTIREKAAKIRKGAIVKDKTGKEHKVDSISGGDAIIHLEGNRYKRVNRRNLELVKEAPGATPMEFEHVEGDDVSFAIAQLYDVYQKYINHVAKTKNGVVFDEEMNNAFKQIKDFFILQQDHRKMVSTINKLSDPDYFNRFKDIAIEIEKVQAAQKLKHLEDAMDEFKKLAVTNKMLNELYDAGLFVMPEDVDNLLNFEVVDFFDVANKEQVAYDSPKYKQALDIIEKYAGQAKTTVKKKVTPEAGTDEGAKERKKYDAKARPKLANDKRTYADHAKQFGFDGKAQSSTVDATVILKKIATSPHATAAEKALARRLLSAVKPGMVFTFVNNHSTPGSYNTGTKQITVDARYSSNDYALGEKGHPIEFVMLHEIMHAFTVEGLETDPEFKKAIEGLLKAVNTYQQAARMKPLYGTMNDKEFVAEALANPEFQDLLRKVPYTVTGKPGSAWDEFVNTLRTFLKRLFGVADENNALNEAMYIITAKLDKEEAAPTKQASGKGPTTITKTEPIKTTTPIGQMKIHVPELVNQLVQAYHAYNKENELAPDNTPFGELTASDLFKKFVTETGTAADVINAFNADPKNGRVTTAKPVAKSQAKVKPQNPLAPGNKWLFSGKTLHPEREVMENVPVEVVEERQGYDAVSDSDIHEVILRDLNTGELFPVDLKVVDKTFKLLPIPLGSLTETISDEQWTAFQDKNEIPAEVLQAIAQKIKSGSPLTPRETAIFTGRTGDINEILAKEFTETKSDYKGIPLEENSTIINDTGAAGAAQYDRKKNIIRVNRVLLRQKYDQKAWTKSRKLSDSSSAKPLDADTFSSYEDFERFVIEHEFQHSILTEEQFKLSRPSATKGEYEDEINRRALAELGLLKEEEITGEKPLMEAYSEITNKTELNEWKDRALDAVGSSAQRKKISEAEGIEFNADYVKQLVEDKEKGLAMSLEFDDLNPGTVVVMKTNKLMVVKERTQKDVILVSPAAFKSGDPTAGTTTIAKEAIKSQIKMRHSEFIDKAEKEVPLTDEEIKESDETLKSAASDEAAEISEDNKKAETIKTEQANQDLLDKIRKCKKK